MVFQVFFYSHLVFTVCNAVCNQVYGIFLLSLDMYHFFLKCLKRHGLVEFRIIFSWFFSLKCAKAAEEDIATYIRLPATLHRHEANHVEKECNAEVIRFSLVQCLLLFYLLFFVLDYIQILLLSIY